MRIAGFFLAALVAFAPVLQARSCFCDAAPAADEAAGTTSCCCGDAAVCACANCPGHGQDDRDAPSSLSGCVCTKTQPQANAEQPVDIAPAEAFSLELSIVADAPRPAFHAVRALEDNLRPACNPPLLV